MKFGEELFPVGTFPRQESDGAYINETLGANLDILARKIVDDMHFLGLISGHDGVGNGKTTLLTHVCCYLTWKINQLHKTNNTFTERNIVFNSKDLVTRSFELPQYSVIALDEGDDLTTHGMKELAVRLKRYFRKARQLNQIIILILPSFFELPKFYALSRSHFLLDVQFKGEYERGFFKFYSPLSKKLLYLKGKKEWNYDAHPCDFEGRFFSNYAFFPDVDRCTEAYKRLKYSDMVDDSKEQEETKPYHQIEREIKMRIFKQVYERLGNVSQKRLADAFSITERCASLWLKKLKEGDVLDNEPENRMQNNYNNITIKDSDLDEDEEQDD